MKLTRRVSSGDTWVAYGNNIDNCRLVGCDAGLYFGNIVTFRSYQLHPSVGTGLPRGVWVFNPPPLIFQRPSKIVPNWTRLWKLLKIAEFRTPTPQDVWKKGSKILKLPSVRNCFILATTHKLVVVINSLKVPKIKKILLYEIKFLVRNYNCLQNPWLGGYRPQIPVLCPQLNLLNIPPPPNKIPGYATVCRVYPDDSNLHVCCAVMASWGFFS